MPMKLKLYIGRNEVAFDFETTEDRDVFWDNLAANASFGFKPQDAANKCGSHTIQIDPTKFPFGYRWPFISDEPPTPKV